MNKPDRAVQRLHLWMNGQAVQPDSGQVQTTESNDLANRKGA